MDRKEGIEDQQRVYDGVTLLELGSQILLVQRSG